MKLRPTDRRRPNRWAAGTRWQRQKRMGIARTMMTLFGLGEQKPPEQKTLN